MTARSSSMIIDHSPNLSHTRPTLFPLGEMSPFFSPLSLSHSYSFLSPPQLCHYSLDRLLSLTLVICCQSQGAQRAGSSFVPFLCDGTLMNVIPDKGTQKSHRPLYMVIFQICCSLVCRLLLRCHHICVVHSLSCVRCNCQLYPYSLDRLSSLNLVVCCQS